MSAFLAAAIALPALLVMYLLKLRRRPLRVSSVMLWPEAATDVQVNVPLAPPRPSWLMLLHVLIAMALIAAVGRPVLLNAGERAGRVLVIIDRSASMSAMDGATSGGERISRLDEAKRRARETIGRSSGATQVAVVTVAASAEIVREFSSDLAAASAAVDRITATDQPGDLAAAMEIARAMLGGTGTAEEFDAGVEVLVFSDGSFAEGAREVAAPGGVVRLVRCGPTPAIDKRNLGIVVLSARRDADRPEVINLFAKVQNSSSTPRSVPVRLSIDGAVLETKAVAVGASAAGIPGETGVVLSATAPSGGIAMISLLVDDERDLLVSDNSASMNLRSSAPVRILLVQRGSSPRFVGEPAPALSADFLLADALEEVSPGTMTRVGRERYEELVAAGELKFYDVIVFDGVVPQIAPALPSLSFGAGVPGLDLGAANGSGEARPVQSWIRSSPFLRDITLDGVVVANERAFGGKSAEVLARSERGPLIVASRSEDGPGRVVVTFALEDSNWPLQAGFPIFLKSALELLTSKGAASAGVQFLTVQPVYFEGVGAPTEFVGPVRAMARPAPGHRGSAVQGAVQRMTLGVLDRAGVYTPVAGADSGFPPIAVNLLNAHESAVATGDSLRVGSRVIGTGGSIARPKEIWWWMLVLAAGLLAIEWLVFARSARL